MGSRARRNPAAIPPLTVNAAYGGQILDHEQVTGKKLKLAVVATGLGAVPSHMDAVRGVQHKGAAVVVYDNGLDRVRESAATKQYA
jgi:hypothetical protein